METARGYLTANTILLIGWVVVIALFALATNDELGFVASVLGGLLLVPSIIAGALGVTRFFVVIRKTTPADRKTAWMLLGTSVVLLVPLVYMLILRR